MSVFVKNDSIDPVMAGEGLQEGKGKCIQGVIILELYWKMTDDF